MESFQRQVHGQRRKRTALAEHQLIELLLDFANSEDSTSALRGMERSGWFAGFASHEEETEWIAEEFEHAREALRYTLNSLCDGAPLEPHIMHSESPRIAIFPSFRFEAKRFLVSHHYIAQRPDAVVLYASLLLLDLSRPYGRDLCRCQLPCCRKFFLAVRPSSGRARRSYCSEEHMLQAHSAGSSRRVAASRKARAE